MKSDLLSVWQVLSGGAKLHTQSGSILYCILPIGAINKNRESSKGLPGKLLKTMFNYKKSFKLALYSKYRRIIFPLISCQIFKILEFSSI